MSKRSLRIQSGPPITCASVTSYAIWISPTSEKLVVVKVPPLMFKPLEPDPDKFWRIDATSNDGFDVCASGSDDTKRIIARMRSRCCMATSFGGGFYTPPQVPWRVRLKPDTTY